MAFEKVAFGMCTQMSCPDTQGSYVMRVSEAVITETSQRGYTSLTYEITTLVFPTHQLPLRYINTPDSQNPSIL
jgi:hypothetical protein